MALQPTRVSTHVLTLVLALGIADPVTAAVEKEPYLFFPGIATQMRLLWQLTSSEPCTVEWGYDSSYSLGSVQTSEYGNDHQHIFGFSDLTPGQRVHYRVTASGTHYEDTFFAAPPAASTSLRFLAYGDTRSNPSVHDDVAAAMVATMSAEPGFQTLVAHVGDLVDDGDSESSWNSQFFDSGLTNIREMMARSPLQACRGNHEGTGQLFAKYFPYPVLGGRYWSFDYGPVHFVFVDQYTSYSPGSPQLMWIEYDLATTVQPWKILVFHQPGWSAGGHANDVAVQDWIQPLCEEYGVSVCLTGHNHYYARAVVNGVHHVTTGGGGAPLTTPDPGYPYVVATERAYHFCRIEIMAGALQFVAVTPQGTVIDSFGVENPTPVGDPMTAVSVAQPLVYPNPFRRVTNISFTLERAGRLRFSIFDVAGRRVLEGPDRTLAAGPHTIRWDGRNFAGRPAPAGTYFIVLSGVDGTRSQRLVLVR